MKFRPALFWDTDPKKINKRKHARYIIERILELGDLSDVKWLLNYYPSTKIKTVLKLPRVQVRDKSKALWELILK